jgi:phosphoglucomutase
MPSLYKKTESAVQSLSLPDDVKATTLAHLKTWLLSEQFADYLPQLTHLIESEKWNFLVDCFYQLLPFGTGGRRGTVGVGTNRFNHYTLTSSIQGHAEYLKRQKEKMGWESLTVVVAFDVRQFHDNIGSYNAELPNPCYKMTSRNFSEIAAGVYAANGITVWTLPDEEEENLATPELSFLIRHLGAQGGLNVSASHNPPDDNGAKLYNYTGGQEVPPNDEEMVRLVDQVDVVKEMPYREAQGSGLIKSIDPSAPQVYRETVLATSLQPSARNVSVAYSPLHGAGKSCTGKVLEEAGFNVHKVEEQWDNADGRFPNVPGNIANPEEPTAMVLAAKVADQHGAELAITTDPDADRFGAVVKHSDGKIHYLDGNELALLVCHYILECRSRLGTLPERPLVIKTEVTTSAIARVAELYGAHCIGNLLVGFKYIGDILRQIDETGAYEGREFSPDDYLFGCEESHGCLVTTAIRDKDSAGASLLLAELAAVCKAEGRTIVDYLTDIYRKIGCTRNIQLSVVMAGATGQAMMRKTLRSLRSDPITAIGGQQVTKQTDLRDPDGVFGAIKSETDRLSRNVLLFDLADGNRVAIRPSGTEPKAKFYFEGTAPLGDDVARETVQEEIDSALMALADDFTATILNRAGVPEDVIAKALRQESGTQEESGVVVLGIKEHEWKVNFDAFWRMQE